jgi:hypothetical protein
METKRVIRLTIFLYSILMSSLFAQERDVKVYLDRDSLSLGDQVILWIEARYPREEVLEWPDVAKNVPEQFEVLKQGGLDTIPEGLSYVHYKQQIILGCYKDGAFTWGMPAFIFSNRAGTYSDSVRVSSLIGEVFSPDVDINAPFRDILGAIDPPRHWKEFVYEIILISGLLVLILTGLLLFRYLKRRPKPEPKAAVEVIIPSHILALSALDELERSSLISDLDRRPYYTELSRIIRAYLEGRFRIDAEEMSSTEIKQAYTLVCASQESEAYLNQVLKAADLVKFAKARPSENQARSALSDARQFVELTAMKSDM